MKITKMTKQSKPNLVSTILVIVSLFGLYCSAVNAKTAVKEKPQSTCTKKNVVIEIKSPAGNITKNMANNYAYPSITSEIFYDYNQIKTPLFIQVARQPLLDIQVANFAHLAPNKFEKKSSIFEFAAKFNDKLQQILSYFDFSTTSENNRNKPISEKNINSKIQLITHYKIKPLKANCSASKS